MEDERTKKLAAGRDRLAKFQKKKKKKKTKEPKATNPEKIQDTSVESVPSFFEDHPNGGDSVEEFSAGSSDLLGSNSDILSSLSEIDRRSIGTDDLCQDSDASQLDAEVARLELGEARTRIHQLEESMLGKQTALTLLQNELSELRSQVNNNTDHSTTNGDAIENTQVNGSSQEAELRAALEQYNIKHNEHSMLRKSEDGKGLAGIYEDSEIPSLEASLRSRRLIQEFQQALKQRDEVIQQLTANMQTVAQSRDAVQADATAQVNQLSDYIQSLQGQLKETGESLRNQSGEQMSSLAEELGLAQNQVTALQQNVADKDAIMKQLADRYTQKAQEVIELAEERDDLKRKNLGEISALQQKLKESTGEVSPLGREDSLLRLQAELDESYGSQIVMIKQQLDDKHQQELGLWKQRYDEMERIAAASSDSNLMRTELENQLKEANERLSEKDREILDAKGSNENLSLKLANLVASHQKHLDELDANHRNELDFVREEAKKRTQEHLDEVQRQLESTQGELDTSLYELEEERKKAADVEDELAEKALNTSSLQGNLTKEIGILAKELERKDDEIRDLNQVRTNLHEQLNKLTSDREERNARYQSQIHDLSTEYSKLQAEITELRAGKRSPEGGADWDALRNELEDELQREYEDRVEDLNIAHAATIQQIRSELSFEHENEMKKEKFNLQMQFEQKLENASVTKQHEFVTELQKVQEELSNKFEADFNEKLEEERAKLLTNPPGTLGGGDQDGESNMNRLQAEVQELSEARDALMTQVDSTAHEKEALQEELRQIITEKGTLTDMTAPISPRELSSAASTLEDAQLSIEVESLRNSLGKTEEEKGDMERRVSELEDRLALSESERQLLMKEIEGMEPQLESVIQERDQLLSVKEELQHRLEGQGKAHELLEEKVSELQDIFIGAESEKEALKEEIREVNLQLETLDRVRVDLMADKEELQNQLKEQTEAKGGGHDDLERRISDLEQLLADSESEKQTLSENVATVIRQKDQLLTDKEELQHRLEAQEKEHEGKMMEVMAERESIEAELEKATAEVRRTREMSEPSPEIEQLQETLSELARLQEKGSKVDLLEGELQLLRGRLQDLEDHVCEGEEGSESDRLEILQDQLVSQQQMVSSLTNELRVAREKVGVLRGQQGDSGVSWEEELSALKMEVQDLRGENKLLMEAREGLARDLFEKENDLENKNVILNRLEEEVDAQRNENVKIEEGVQELKEPEMFKDNEIQENDEKCELSEHRLKEISSESVVVQAGHDGEGRDQGTEVVHNAECVSHDLYEDSDVSDLKELSLECDRLKGVVSERDEEIQRLLLQNDERVTEIRALTNDMDLMERGNEESVAKENETDNAVKELESVLDERKGEIEDLTCQLGDLDERMGVLGEQLSLVQTERDTLVDQTIELSKNLTDEKMHVKALEEELGEVSAERDLHSERTSTLELELKCGRDRLGGAIQGSPNRDLLTAESGEEKDAGCQSLESGETTDQGTDGVSDVQSLDEKLHELLNENEQLRERLEYTEKESVREKKEYDNRLTLTEEELIKSCSLQTVLTAQMNAQRKMFEDDVHRMAEEIDRLQAGARMNLSARMDPEVGDAFESHVIEDVGLEEVERPGQGMLSPRAPGVGDSVSLEKKDVDILWQDIVGSYMEELPVQHESKGMEQTVAPKVVEEMLSAEIVGGDLSSLPVPETLVSRESSGTDVENLWQEVVGISSDEFTDVHSEISDADSEFEHAEEVVIVADHVSQYEERTEELVRRFITGEAVTNENAVGEAPTSDPVDVEVSAPFPTFSEEPSTGDLDREFEKLWQEVGQLKEESKSKEDELLKMEQHAQLMSWEKNDALRELGEAKAKLTTLSDSLMQKGEVTVNLEERLNQVNEQLGDALADVKSVKTERDILESRVAKLEESLVLLNEEEQEHIVLTEELVGAKDQLDKALGNSEVIQEDEGLECQSLDPEELSKMLEMKNQENAALKEELARVTEVALASQVTHPEDSARSELIDKENNVVQQDLEKVKIELEDVLCEKEAVQGQKAGLEQEVSKLRETLTLLEAERDSHNKQLSEITETLTELRNTSEEKDRLSSQSESAIPEKTVRANMDVEDGVSVEENAPGERLDDRRHGSDSDEPEREELGSDVRSLQDELDETEEVYYTTEQGLLEEEKATASPADDGTAVMLSDLLDKKEQQEKEMLAEKNLQISVLQEANARLEKELEDVLNQLEKAEAEMKHDQEVELHREGTSVAENTSPELRELTMEDIPDEIRVRDESNAVNGSSGKEGIDTGGMQSVDSSKRIEAMRVKMDEIRARKDLDTIEEDDQGLADRLEESIAREEALMKEKDLLLEKIAEQEEIHRRLAEEREELQRQLSDKRRLEELLLERDRLEQELARQKTTMESDLSDLESHLAQRENHLLREKCHLQEELKQKDLLLRRWEVGFREHQMKLRSQELLLERQYSEQLTRVQEDLREGQSSHLEKLRAEVERRHAEAISRLKRDLHQEFALREARLNESHLSDVAEMKGQHSSQLKELLAEAEARNESLRQELEAERQNEHNHGNGPSQGQTEAFEGSDLDRLESLKNSLDEGDRKILDEVIQERDDINNQKIEEIKAELESQHRQEEESLKATAEAVYSAQLDDQLARSEQEKSQALVEQMEALQERQEQELAVMRKNWAEREQEYERQFEERDEVDGLSTEQLIGQLQKRLSEEHHKTLQDLSQECDQVSLDYLEALRARMENDHRQDLAGSDPHQQIEGSILNRWESESQLDDEALIAEREKVVAHSEEMKRRLDSLHSDELSSLRAAMQADYDALVRAKEDLEKSKSQTEESLRQELEGLRDAFEDLQQKYAEERESTVNQLAGDGTDTAGHLSRLQSEVEELQRELTQQRKKLQDDHAEELSKLKGYFETELATTEEKWLKEMERIEDMKGEGNVSWESSVEEPDVVATKRPDLPHSLMTLTHISDTDSSPPRSPKKSRDTEAEFRQQLRGEVERDYQRSLENLRNELENEHKAEIARISLEHDLKHEQDLRQEKDALTRKHEHETHKLEMKQLEALENLRKELDDYHAREMARARMEAAGEMAKMVEEERENAKEDYRQQLAEAVKETEEEAHQKAVKDLEELQSRLEEEHRQEVDKLAADQDDSDGDDRIQQELERLREQLTAGHTRAIEELRESLEESKAREIEEILEKHEIEAQEKAANDLKEREDELERVKGELIAEHLEDKASAIEELKAALEESKAREIEELLEKHEQEAMEKADKDVKEREEELAVEHEENVKRALEGLRTELEETHSKEIAELSVKHQLEMKELADRGAKEREDLKASYDQRWNEEKAEMNRVLEEQLKQFGDSDSLLEQLRENHEEEKARLREELTKEHMEKFEEVTTELEAGHLRQLEEMRDETQKLVEEDYLEKMKAMEEEMKDSFVAEVEEMNRKNEEVSRKMAEEFEEKMKAAALESEKDIESAKMELEEAHQQEIQEIETRHKASLEEEKGSLDARLKEREDHWKTEMNTEQEKHQDIQQKLLDEINQVQEEKAALANKNNLEQARRKREHEETTNLISMLQSDVDNLNAERGNLQQANTNLLQVLSQAVRTVITAEESISRRVVQLDGRGRSSADGQEARPSPTGGNGGGDETPSNTSLLSNDEGLELSQQLSESIFAGPELDAEAEELVINAASKLQSSIQALMGRMDQLRVESPSVQVMEEEPLLQAGQVEALTAPPTPPVDHLKEEKDRLEERLQEESAERQQLGAELDRMEGLLQGLQTERDAQDQSLKALEEEKIAVVIDLETARNARTAADGELQRLRVQHDDLQEELERLQSQQNQLQKDTSDQIAREVDAIQKENESLQKESDSIQRKAKRDRDTLQAKIQELEATLEDSSSRWERDTEARNLEMEDLKNQLEAANKIVKANKEFQQQQGMEREQEREDFQKEITRLEGLVGQEKPNNHEEYDLQSQLEDLEKENADLRQSEEELAHEKEALHKQCYEQLHQISALQSKLDANKHGLGTLEPEEEPPSDLDDVSEASMASVTLTQQLEQEREALGRKNSEMKALEEQLDQFRDNLVSKEDEISQLKLQVDIADKASLRDDSLKDNDSEVLELKVQLDRAEETILELRQHLDQTQADLDQARSDLDQARFDLDQARADLDLAQTDESSPQQQELLHAQEAHAGEIRQLETELNQKLQDKDTEVIQLKIQLDREEETVLDLRQQLAARESSEPSAALKNLQAELEHIREEHHRAVEELERNHQEIVARMEEEHRNEVAGMLAAQDEDWKKIRELENEYKGKIGHLGTLSPGKTLHEKIEEIKAELTAQHQEHIADIQRTMAREAEERVQQVKGQIAQDAILRQQRHQHELEEAILRTNRDLLAAHAEEVTKLREDQRQEIERLLAASPINLSQIGDISHAESEVRGRPSSIAHELPSQADSGVGAGDVTTEGLSDKLKTILARLRGEGLSLLSLSELRYLHDQTAPRPPLQEGASLSAIQDAWDNERRALKDGLQALGDLITQINTTQLKSDADLTDWRGELLHALQNVFHTQRDALRAELATGVAMSGDQNITQLQLLERRIRDQENFHKSAVEQIYGADRASILGETRDLHDQNASLREELQRSRQKLTQQLKTLEDVSGKRERQLKRQLETMEHKYRQERILVEDLRTSLSLEKEKTAQLSEMIDKVKGQYEEQQEEVGDLLTKIDRQTADQETLESRLTDMTAAFETERSQNQTLNSTIADERKTTRNLQESFETENYRLSRARTQEQRIIKELHREMQAVKDRLVQAGQIAEREGQRATSLAKDLEAIRAETVTEEQHEKARFTELKTALDVEKSRCQELKTALQREQALNAQLHSTVEQERQATAEASLQDKGALSDVQASLDRSQAELLKVQGQCQQLENSIQRKDGILETERRQHKESLAQERAGARQLKAALDGIESQLAETRRQLSYEQEKNARLTAEKERLKHSQDHIAQEGSERELQREREREADKRRQLEREREREMDRQKLRDLELAHQLAQQRIEALGGEVEDWRGQAQQALEELQAAQEKKHHHHEEEQEEMEEMEQALEKEFKDSEERVGPAGRESKHNFNQTKEQLEAIRQRLQLIAVRQSEGMGLLTRLNQSVTSISSGTRHEIQGLERNLQEVTAELRQINGALILQTETSNGLPASQSRLNSRLLNQNAELTDYITKLSEDKSGVRRQVAQLEEQLWNVRHRSSMSPRANIAAVVADERSSWDRERATIQNSLRQAEREIIRLKLDLERTAREGDVDMQANGSNSSQGQSKYQRLYGKYLRAESFRKSLVYQKRYLLLLLGNFQHTEEAALALIARMGGYPNPSNMPQAQRRHSAAFSKFRSAVRVVIAVARLKYLKNKWQRARGSGRAESRAGSRAQSRGSQLSGPSPNFTPPRITHSSASGPTPPVFNPSLRMESRSGTGRTPPSYGTPPVRERSYMSNGSMVNGTHYHTSHSFRSTLSSGARRSLSPGEPVDQSDVSLSQYIQRLENLQERIPTDGRSEER